MTVPKECKAAITRNPGPDYTFELVENYPVPVPKAGELLLKLNCTGLCQSDHHYCNGDWGASLLSDCSGHEGAGVVAALGPDVDPTVWKVGDRAGLKCIYDVCHTCDRCRGGMEVHCKKAVSSGFMVNGSFCEYVVSPASYTTRIPDGVSDPIAAVLQCSGVTIFQALRASKAQAGQWVVIPGGGGGVGHQALQFGKVLGLRMIAIDTGAEKEKMCLEMGAQAFLDFKTCPNVTEEVLRLTEGEGAHAVVVTGATAAAYATAPSFLRVGGVLVAIGLPPASSGAIVGIDPFTMINKKLTFVGSAVGTFAETDDALNLAACGWIKPQITVVPFKDFNKAFTNLVQGKVAGRMVVDYNQ